MQSITGQHKPVKQKSFIKLVTPNLRSQSNESSPEKQIQLPRQGCSDFFHICMNGKQLKQNEKYTIHQDVSLRKIGDPASPNRHQFSNTQQKNERKRKISLSIKKKTSQQFSCSKQGKDTNEKMRYLSQSKKTEPKRSSQSNHPTKQQNTTAKIKNTPERQKIKTQQNHHLKQSKLLLKGSIHSSKKSNDSKSKLTLSSTFKSQIKSSQRKEIPQFSLKPIAQQTNPQSQQVIIEESFMTAKLKNIYGERSSELELFPNSNIVYYNQLMANEHLWRAPTSLPQPHDITFHHQPYYNDDSNRQDFRDVSIQKQIPQQLNEKDSQQQINFKFNLRERKRIGEYAKTIKTFNQSQLRSNDLNSQNESIVLEKGFSQYPQGVSIITAHRGSIKGDENQYLIDLSKRPYGSVGQDYSHANLAQGQYKFTKLVSQTIEEDLYDSEINYECRQ